MAEKKTNSTEEVVEEVAVVEPETTEEVAVVEPELVEEAVAEVVAEPVAEVVAEPVILKYAEPVAVTAEDIANAVVTPAGPAVVGNGEVDDVLLSSCVYKNDANRRSLTVFHVQRRLIELELLQDGSVKAGYYGDLTRNAVLKFQESKGIPGDGLMNADTFTALFEGDPNVRVSLS
jgi:hypothetical protein